MSPLHIYSKACGVIIKMYKRIEEDSTKPLQTIPIGIHADMCYRLHSWKTKNIK